MQKVTRPIIRYHGGKFLLADWIISNFVPHSGYTEVYGGGASVLLKKPKSYFEVYNDLDGEIVNLFRVCRDQGPALLQAIELTPFARQEMEDSYEQASDAVEQARRTVVRSFQGFGSVAASGHRTGFRANSNRSGTTPAHDWRNWPGALPAIIDRLRGVVIENRPALDVLRANDRPDVLHFLDPPYMAETRSDKWQDNAYRYEMGVKDHEELLDAVRSLEGMVFLSGYDNDLYNQELRGWQKVYKSALADGARPRTEVLWVSPKVKNKNLFS